MNIKIIKDGRFKLVLPNDVREIFTKALMVNYQIHEGEEPEYYLSLIDETVLALQQENIRLTKSQFFLLFDELTQRHVDSFTQQYVSSYLEIDEFKRTLIQRKFNPKQLGAHIHH